MTFLTCKAKYVASIACVCQVIWLRRLLKVLNFEQDETTDIFIDKKLATALGKNPIFHNISKYVDTKNHFIREYMGKKEI